MKKRNLTEGTYSLNEKGNVTGTISKPRKKVPKPDNFSNLRPGFYAVDQHKQIRGGPYATETEVKQKAHKDDFSYGVLRVKGKSNGKG